MPSVAKGRLYEACACDGIIMNESRIGKSTEDVLVIDVLEKKKMNDPRNRLPEKSSLKRKSAQQKDMGKKNGKTEKPCVALLCMC